MTGTTTNPAHSDQLLTDLARVRAQFQMESLKQYMERPLTAEELFERVIAEDLATMRIPQEELNKWVIEALDKQRKDGVE